MSKHALIIELAKYEYETIEAGTESFDLDDRIAQLISQREENG